MLVPETTEPANRQVVVARCRGLLLAYKTAVERVIALDRVHADFRAGRLSVIAGPSGSGKSSLLRVLAGLQPADSGLVEVAGFDVGSLRRGQLRRLRRHTIGLVLQRPSDNLLPYLRMSEQFELSARLRGVRGDDIDELVELLELHGRRASYPRQLSGGEQQRAAFVAAVIGRPAIVLADEPTAELDAGAGAHVVEALQRLVEHGSSLIVASHDPAVIAAADDLVTLRDGRVETER